MPLLTKALSDPQQSVRRGAAAALGRKRVRSALLALRQALGDAEPDVRRAGMMSVSRVAAHLLSRGANAHDDELILRLRQFVETGNTEDQLTAAGTLLQLGEHAHRERLREGLQAPDPLTRKLVVEMLPAGDELLRHALADQALSVRLRRRESSSATRSQRLSRCCTKYWPAVVSTAWWHTVCSKGRRKGVATGVV